jgi:hypothetical protein
MQMCNAGQVAGAQTSLCSCRSQCAESRLAQAPSQAPILPAKHNRNIKTLQKAAVVGRTAPALGRLRIAQWRFGERVVRRRRSCPGFITGQVNIDRDLSLARFHPGGNQPAPDQHGNDTD